MFIRTLGGLLLLVGAVWTLQGIGIVKGSFMTGSALWGVLGLICLVTGLVLVTVKSRRTP